MVKYDSHVVINYSTHLSFGIKCCVHIFIYIYDTVQQKVYLGKKVYISLLICTVIKIGVFISRLQNQRIL